MRLLAAARSLRAKLYAGFAAVLALLVVLGVVGLSQLSSVAGGATRLNDDIMPSLALISTIVTNAEIYRALIEATAFGALTIIRRIEECGVPVRDIIAWAPKVRVGGMVSGHDYKPEGSERTPALSQGRFRRQTPRAPCTRPPTPTTSALRSAASPASGIRACRRRGW